MPFASIRLEAHCHRTFVDAQPAPTAIPWLRNYYDGLLKPYGLQPDLSRLEGGRNNDFLAMGGSVMRSLQATSRLDDVCLFLMAHQTLDTYQPFRSTTTLLCREFGIEAPAAGMTEQELSAPYVALLTLQAALRHNDEQAAGLLLVLDQANLPYARPNAADDCVDNALVMRLSSSADVVGPAVHIRRYWAEDAARTPAWIMQCIHAYLDQQRADVRQVRLVLDESIHAALADQLPADACLTDPRLMSTAGFVAAIEALNHSTQVLLVNLADDGQLFLVLFSDAPPPRGDACSI